MKNLLNKLKLKCLVYVHISSSLVSDWLYESKLLRKLHPSEWSIVRKIRKSSWYKNSVNCFKSLCNSTANLFGFEPIFEIKRNDNFIGKVRDSVNDIGNTAKNCAQDYYNTASLINELELLKLKSVETIYSSIDSWHKNISKNVNSKRLNCHSDSDFIKVLKPSIQSLNALSETTDSTLTKLRSLKSKKPIILDFYADEINRNIDQIFRKNTAIKREIYSLKKELNSHSEEASVSDSISFA